MLFLDCLRYLLPFRLGGAKKAGEEEEESVNYLINDDCVSRAGLLIRWPMACRVCISVSGGVSRGTVCINWATPSNFLSTQTFDPKHVIWNIENAAVHLPVDCDTTLQALGPHD